MIITRGMRKQLERSNQSWPVALCQVPRSEWLTNLPGQGRIEVWRSRDYLVQVFDEGGGVLRLSANRTVLLPTGRWDEGLSWDELQSLKRQIGRGDVFAVEIYPPDADVVNVANMRHLWLLPEPMQIGWRRAAGSVTDDGARSSLVDAAP